MKHQKAACEQRSCEQSREGDEGVGEDLIKQMRPQRASPCSAACVARSASLWGAAAAATLAMHRPVSRQDTLMVPRQASGPPAGASALSTGCRREGRI